MEVDGEDVGMPQEFLGHPLSASISQMIDLGNAFVVFLRCQHNETEDPDFCPLLLDLSENTNNLKRGQNDLPPKLQQQLHALLFFAVSVICAEKHLDPSGHWAGALLG